MLKSLIKDTTAYGLNEVIFRLVNFIVFPILANFLTVEDFGTATLLTTVTCFISVFFFGLGNSLQKYYFDPKISSEERASLVSTSLLMLLAIAPALILFFAGIAYPFQEKIFLKYAIGWRILLVAILTILPLQLFELIRTVLRLHFAPWKYTLFTNMYNLIYVTLTLYWTIAWEMGIEGMIWGNFIANLLICPLGLWLIRKDLTWTFRIDFAKQLWSFGYPFIFTSLAYWIFLWTDRLMLGELSSATELGKYSVAAKFGMILSFVINTFGRAWSPLAFKARLEDPHYRTNYSRVFTIWCFVLVVLQAGTSLFAAEALRLLMPATYWSVANLLPCIAFGLAMSGTTQVTAFGISLEGKSFFLTRGSWIAAIANLLLNSLLIPDYGAMGAVVATAASYALLTIYYLFHSQRLHPIPIEWRQIGTITMLALAVLIISAKLMQFECTLLLFTTKLFLMLILIMAGHWFKLMNYRALIHEFMRWVKQKRRRNDPQSQLEELML